MSTQDGAGAAGDAGHDAVPSAASGAEEESRTLLAASPPSNVEDEDLEERAFEASEKVIVYISDDPDADEDVEAQLSCSSASLPAGGAASGALGGCRRRQEEGTRGRRAPEGPAAGADRAPAAALQGPRRRPRAIAGSQGGVIWRQETAWGSAEAAQDEAAAYDRPGCCPVPCMVFHDLPHSENLRDDANGENGTLSRENGNGTGTHLTSVIKSPQVRRLTFLGWQFGHKTKQKSYSEKELQRSDSVLGYAAQIFEAIGDIGPGDIGFA